MPSGADKNGNWMETKLCISMFGRCLLERTKMGIGWKQNCVFQCLGDAFWSGQKWELDGNKTVYFNVWEMPSGADKNGNWMETKLCISMFGRCLLERTKM